MKKVLAYSAIFIVAYCLWLIATIPASFLLSQVKLPDNIQVQGVSGTAWQAKIEQVNTPQISIHQVKTNVGVLSLFSLTPNIDITFGDALKPGPEGKLTLITDGETLSISNAKVMVLVNDIVKNANLPLPINAKGFLDFNIKNFQPGAPICQQLSGDVKWPKASVTAMNESVVLGDLAATFACEDGGVVLTVVEENDLGLSFRAFLRNPNKVTGDGFLKPGAKFPEKMRPLLSFLGKPDQQGRYRLVIK